MIPLKRCRVFWLWGTLAVVLLVGVKAAPAPERTQDVKIVGDITDSIDEDTEEARARRARALIKCYSTTRGFAYCDENIFLQNYGQEPLYSQEEVYYNEQPSFKTIQSATYPSNQVLRYPNTQVNYPKVNSYPPPHNDIFVVWPQIVPNSGATIPPAIQNIPTPPPILPPPAPVNPPPPAPVRPQNPPAPVPVGPLYPAAPVPTIPPPTRVPPYQPPEVFKKDPLPSTPGQGPSIDEIFEQLQAILGATSPPPPTPEPTTQPPPISVTNSSIEQSVLEEVIRILEYTVNTTEKRPEPQKKPAEKGVEEEPKAPTATSLLSKLHAIFLQLMQMKPEEEIETHPTKATPTPSKTEEEPPKKESILKDAIESLKETLQGSIKEDKPTSSKDGIDKKVEDKKPNTGKNTSGIDRKELQDSFERIVNDTREAEKIILDKLSQLKNIEEKATDSKPTDHKSKENFEDELQSIVEVLNSTAKTINENIEKLNDARSKIKELSDSKAPAETSTESGKPAGAKETKPTTENATKKPAAGSSEVGDIEKAMEEFGKKTESFMDQFTKAIEKGIEEFGQKVNELKDINLGSSSFKSPAKEKDKTDKPSETSSSKGPAKDKDTTEKPSETSTPKDSEVKEPKADKKPDEEKDLPTYMKEVTEKLDTVIKDLSKEDFSRAALEKAEDISTLPKEALVDRLMKSAYNLVNENVPASSLEKLSDIDSSDEDNNIAKSSLKDKELKKLIEDNKAWDDADIFNQTVSLLKEKGAKKDQINELDKKIEEYKAYDINKIIAGVHPEKSRKKREVDIKDDLNKIIENIIKTGYDDVTMKEFIDEIDRLEDCGVKYDDILDRTIKVITEIVESKGITKREVDDIVEIRKNALYDVMEAIFDDDFSDASFNAYLDKAADLVSDGVAPYDVLDDSISNIIFIVMKEDQETRADEIASRKVQNNELYEMIEEVLKSNGSEASMEVYKQKIDELEKAGASSIRLLVDVVGDSFVSKWKEIRENKEVDPLEEFRKKNGSFFEQLQPIVNKVLATVTRVLETDPISHILD